MTVVRPLDRLSSIKLKLGVLIVAAVAVSSVVSVVGLRLGWPLLLRPLVASAIGVGMVQILARGMTSPLRTMARQAAAMAKGDYSARVRATSRASGCRADRSAPPRYYRDRNGSGWTGAAVRRLRPLPTGGSRGRRPAGAGDRSLTYAEYARSGYFQLLAVAALTLLILLALRASTDPAVLRAKPGLVALAELAVALTLGIVVSALSRLDLYEQAYGLTMLRLYCQVFAVWIAVVFVLLGLSLGGVARRRQWFLTAATGTGLIVLLALNAANPEALVVRRHLARSEQGRQVDAAYLTALTQDSTDAVPALVAGLLKLEPADRRFLAANLACWRDANRGGWAAANWSRRRTARVLRTAGGDGISRRSSSGCPPYAAQECPRPC